MLNVLITLSLCIALAVVLMVKRRQDNGTRTSRSSAGRRRQPFSLRRRSRRNDAPEAPRRRLRPRLALSVPERLAENAPSQELVPHPVPAAEPIISPILASPDPVVIVKPTPPPSADLWESDDADLADDMVVDVADDAVPDTAPADETPVYPTDSVSVVPVPVTVIAAPGWPEPGELTAVLQLEEFDPLPPSEDRDVHSGSYYDDADSDDIAIQDSNDLAAAGGWTAATDHSTERWDVPDAPPSTWSDDTPDETSDTTSDWSGSDWTSVAANDAGSMPGAEDAPEWSDDTTEAEAEAAWEPTDDTVSEWTTAIPSVDGDASGDVLETVYNDDPGPATFPHFDSDMSLEVAAAVHSSSPPSAPTDPSAKRMKRLEKQMQAMTTQLAELTKRIDDAQESALVVTLGRLEQAVSALAANGVPTPRAQRGASAPNTAARRTPTTSPRPRRAQAFVLTDAERATLRTIGARRSNPLTSRQARAILAASRGVATAVSAAQFGVHPATVRRWKAAFAEKRLTMFSPEVRRPATRLR